MMYATKIKMRPGCSNSNNVQEIDSIYLTGTIDKEGFYPKAGVHDYLKNNPKGIQVNISPYPYLIPVTSSRGEKYVRSEADDTPNDNLLKLPRE
jgi:hypothetical protein